MSKTQDRGPTEDEPQVPFYVISANGPNGTGVNKLHIPAAGGRRPICESVTHGGGKPEWRTKEIAVRPPAWREGRWCEDCRDAYERFGRGQSDGDLEERMSISKIHLTGEIAEEVNDYCRRMGLTKGEIFRAAIKQFFRNERENDDE